MTEDAPRTLDEVPGWFPITDQELFSWFLAGPEGAASRGDLLELGCYLGKSAILLGRHLRPDETLTVCDLFESPAPTAANENEVKGSYASLTRAGFTRNYLAFHERPPRIVQAPTSAVLDHVRPGTCRFVHVDASHLYEHVRCDIGTARAVLAPGGVVVLDDYRAEHTPGVAAAAWEAVFTRGLRPVCVTGQKLYGTWDDPAPLRDALRAWARDREDWWMEEQDVAGAPLLRLMFRPRSRVPRQATAGADHSAGAGAAATRRVAG